MAEKKIVFYLFDAFLQQITGPGKAKIWLDRDFAIALDMSKLFEVNIGLTPSAVAASSIAIDDQVADDGLTSFDPDPELGKTPAGVYLVDIVAAKKCMKHWPPTHRGIHHDYQLMSVMVVDDATTPPTIKRRYHGFHAFMTARAANGKAAVYTVWAANEPPTTPANGLSVVLKDEDLDLSMTTVKKPGEQGALFVEWDAGGKAGIPLSKTPLGEALGALPRRKVPAPPSPHEPLVLVPVPAVQG